MKPRRTMLFTPGDSFDMMEKAAKLDADGFILDWEDAVGLDNKEKARTQTEKALTALDFEGKERTIRINSLKTDLGFKDLAEIKKFNVFPEAIVIPKIEAQGEIELIDKWLVGTEIAILPLIETAKGILGIKEIALSSSRVTGLIFGGGDFTLDIGGEICRSTLLFPRMKIILAAAAAGIMAIDYPFLNIKDKEGLRNDTEEAARLGFDGKTVIHPNQIEIVNRSFSPSEEEVTWARRILEAYERSEAGAVAVNGEMVDQMTVSKAKRILEIAEITGQD